MLRGYRGKGGKGGSTGPAGFKFSGAYETSTKYFERMAKRNGEPASLKAPKFARRKIPRF